MDIFVHQIKIPLCCLQVKGDNSDIVYSWTHETTKCGPGKTAQTGTLVIESASLADVGNVDCQARNLATGETLDRRFGIDKPGSCPCKRSL